MSIHFLMGFLESSIDKESACNAGDPGSIPGSGRAPGEGVGYPLQYSWASPVAQLVKNPPAMRETWVQSLGREDPLEKGKAPHSNILALIIPWTIQVSGVARVGHTDQLALSFINSKYTECYNYFIYFAFFINLKYYFAYKINI